MPRINEWFAGTSDSGKRSTILTKNRKLITTLFATTFIILLVLTGIAARVKVRGNASGEKLISQQSHAVLKSSCSSTLYPELCYSALATVVGARNNLVTHKDIIEISLNLTATTVEHNYFVVKQMYTTRQRLTKREKIALLDCLETIDETLDELHEAVKDLQNYHSTTKKSLTRHKNDLETLLSAAMTNQETCLDGFSHDQADKHVRGLLENGQILVERMCSNALAMIIKMIDTDIAVEQSTKSKRKLKEEEAVPVLGVWPEWLSSKDRRLLQVDTVVPDVVVAADGSGDYLTVGEAVAGAPNGSSTRYVIRIKAGVYRENVEVPKKKVNIMFMGDGRSTTFITGSKNVVDGSTTFNSATVAVVGSKFLARDITFENTAGPSKHQAVALRVNSDLSAFYQCDILAYQDTLYVHSNRQFYTSCFIAGTVDFIFGNSAAIFQHCDIHARKPNPNQKNMITAQGRKDPNQNTGIIIQNCRIAATSELEEVIGDFETYLGRPWKEYSRTVVMKSEISNVIRASGWSEWSGSFAVDTLYYGEYLNSGEGAETEGRVTWEGFRVIENETEAEDFTARNFIVGGSWLSETGFPFELGL